MIEARFASGRPSRTQARSENQKAKTNSRFDCKTTKTREEEREVLSRRVRKKTTYSSLVSSGLLYGVFDTGGVDFVYKQRWVVV